MTKREQQRRYYLEEVASMRASMSYKDYERWLTEQTNDDFWDAVQYWDDRNDHIKYADET